LYADDQIIIAKSDDESQMAVNELNKIIKKYDLKRPLPKQKQWKCGNNIKRSN
jgi:hypothetical protein